MTAVERVARAINRQANINLGADPDEFPWEDATEQCREWCRADARAAIEALSTPANGIAAGEGLADRVAVAARDFCAELQEDGEGVPQPELKVLHSALDAWEPEYDQRA